MGEIKLCRNCEHWYTTRQWMGYCTLHDTEKDRWSESASANGCKDYTDKYVKYKVEVN